MFARAPHSSSLLVGALLGAGCYAFPDPQLGTCGNRILEADEDCDDPDDRSCAGCRITCEPLAKETGCPPDKQCGNDEICRTPSGSFATEIRIDRIGTRWIETGDLDGNRRADLVVLLAEPDIEVIHYDEEEVIATVHLDDAAGFAAVGDLGGDGRDDVLVAHISAADPDGGASGLALLGEVGSGSERARVAATFATLTTSGDIARLLAVTPERDRTLEIVSPSVTNRWVNGAREALSVDTPIDVDSNTLGQAVAFADLDGTDTCAGGLEVAEFPRPEVALASLGDVVVRIVSTCGGTNPFELVHLPDVALSSGALGKAGSLFADVNADLRLDLVVQADSGEVLVAYGVGDGSFHGDTDVPEAAGDGTFAAIPLWAPTEASDRLFAVADFDGDGAVELVTAKHYVSAPEACTGACPHPWPDTLVTAVAVDINDDAALDVVGIHGETAVLQLLDVGAEPPFKPQSIDLLGLGRQLAIGDFDRDTIDDVAFLEADEDTQSGAAQHVTVLYGSPVLPWRLERFGPFVLVETLAVEREQTIVARTKDSDGRPAGAFIRPGTTVQDFGLAVRQPVLVRVGDDVVAASIVLRPDDSEERIAHFGFRAGTLSPHDVILGAPLPGMVAGTGHTALATAIDLVGEPAGVDEIVVLGTTAQGGHVWVAQLEPTTGTWSMVDEFAISQGRFARRPLTAELDPDAPPPPGGPGSTLAVGDYDGDGDLDILATVDRTAPVVVVLRNDGGTLARTPLEPFNEQPSFEYAHIEPWHTDAAGKQRWLVGGDEGFGVIDINLENEHIEFQRVDSRAASAIASADVDGDGLLDFVVGTKQDIRIHLAVESIGAL